MGRFHTADTAIFEIAQKISKITVFTGPILIDLTKPDGTLRKLLDVSRLEKWDEKARINLNEG